MTDPKRIQRKRTKDWRMPKGAVSVCRPGKWGNPFAIGKYVCDTKGQIAIETPAQAVAAFEDMLAIDPRNFPALSEIIEHLRGKDLACWCPLDQPCHADVLLKIANPEGAAMTHQVQGEKQG
ncbi:DUF4326 domain-containing protein [Aliisedimentitalea scapharcae]|uniref:DUF4326 domain-containing protein n=1 Tax=Aliisedimentitalea scapharcae TaxID=1524259 RepID=A0ABZ2XT11_9RHOB